MAKERDATKMVCVRLEETLVDELQAVAEAEERTVSQHIRLVLKADMAKRGQGKKG